MLLSIFYALTVLPSTAWYCDRCRKNPTSVRFYPQLKKKKRVSTLFTNHVPSSLITACSWALCKRCHLYRKFKQDNRILKNLKTTIKPMKKYSHDAFSPLLWPEG